MLERRKFRTLGINIPYDFNDSDFEVSELCLRLYLDEYDETPWDALKYLIAEINYGGRVTDDYDRRLMNVYMVSCFDDETLSVPNYRLSSLSSSDSSRISGSVQKCPQHGVVGGPKSVLTWSHSQGKSDGFRVLFGLEPLLHVAPGFGDALLTRRKEGCVRVHGAVHHGVFTHRASL